MNVTSPIFIIGHGRSGTTILYDLFTRHRDTAYFEYFAIKFATSPWKFRFIPYLFPLREWKLGKKIHLLRTSTPSEGTNLWLHFCKVFDYLDETNVTQDMKKYYYSAIEAEIKAFKAKYFVGKYPPNNFRLRWINSMFPQARYIFVSRNPKPVISSLYVKMQKQKDLPDPEKLWAFIKEVYGKNLSDIEACISFYQHEHKVLQKDYEIIKTKAIEVNYTDLVNNTQSILKRLFEFVGLKWYNDLNNQIPKSLEKGNDEKWKTLLNPERAILEKAFQDTHVS